MILTNCCDLGPDEIIAAGYFVENIIPASTADRCGALGIGDQVLAIDDVVLEEWNGSVPDAERLLRTATKLQILPYHAVQKQSRHFTGKHQRNLFAPVGITIELFLDDSLSFYGQYFQRVVPIKLFTSSLTVVLLKSPP